MFGWIVLGLVVVVLAYVRLAPADVAALHKPVEAVEDRTGMGSAVRVLPAGPGTLERVDAAAMGLPRTTRLAGSVEEGRITYVTRSKWMGFPDYTTVEEVDGQIRMYARLRFGRSDMGVNAARLRQLARAVEAGG